MRHAPRHFGAKAPTKAQQRTDAMMIILQRSAAGLDFPEYLIASIARTHSMSTGEVDKLIADERARREGLG